jgi:cytochrome P450
MLFAQDPDDPEERRLSRDEIVDNILLLILAGSETSAGTLTNALLFLGLNRQANQLSQSNTHGTSAWNKLVKEQEWIIGKQKDGTTILDRSTLDECTYLDGVVREALRIKPIIGGSMRGTKATIVVEGYQIPAGWGVTYDRYNTHIMDPTTFQEDLSHMNVIRGFEPNRWQGGSNEGEEGLQRPGQEWIPFGIGPRFCLGYDLALVEMKVFLATLSRKVPDLKLTSPVVNDLEWASDIRWRQQAIIPVPEDGVHIQALQK